MPRRNYLLIFCAAVVSFVCYQAADRNPLARSFSEISDLVEKRYVDKVDRNTLWSGAVRGMLGELSDPYSEYIDPKEAAELEEMLNQEFGGIGIQVAMDPQSNRLTIISPIVGTPAYRAGILAGDMIAKIDGHSASEMKYTEATALIRGKPGDPVQLTVDRPGKTDSIEFPPIKREIINVDSVLGDLRGDHDQWNFLLERNPNIGYIRIASFGEHTAAEFKEALGQLQTQHLQGLVLDLRDDPGGLLPSAIDVCNLLLPAGKPIVSTQGRDGKKQQDYMAESGDKFLNFPMAVLVNHGSASASEIVAACLQDNGRAVVVGERSYGKGTVQNVISLFNGPGILKLTTAEYHRPSGHNIRRKPNAKDSDEWGVMPDKNLTVKMSEEDFQKWMKWRRDRDVVHPHNLVENPTATSNNDRTNAEQTAPETPEIAGSKDWQQNDKSLQTAVQYLEGQIK